MESTLFKSAICCKNEKNNKLWIRKQTSVKFHNWRFERTAVILVVTFTSSKEEKEEAGYSRLLLCILLQQMYENRLQLYVNSSGFF